jgi:hypothetical protein
MEGKMSWWIAAGVIAIVALATALWWWLPKWEVNRLRLTIRDAKARADIEDNLRKTIGQLIGGAAVLIGAAFAYYQSQLTSQATHDQLISQQVSKGFDLLGQAGNDKVTVRVGGAYALEGVMNTSEQYHQPVLPSLGRYGNQICCARLAALARDREGRCAALARRSGKLEGRVVNQACPERETCASLGVPVRLFNKPL